LFSNFELYAIMTLRFGDLIIWAYMVKLALASTKDYVHECILHQFENGHDFR